MNKPKLADHLPYGYTKQVLSPGSKSLISAVACGKRNNKAIQDELAFIAIGEILTKMINETNETESFIEKLFNENQYLKSELDRTRKLLNMMK